jgi:hypothetical protein
MMNRHRTSGNQLRGDGVRQDRRRHFAEARRDRAPRQSRLLTWLLAQLALAGDQAFRVDDALAAARGWQIAVGRAGLTRTYRDPRFDLLAERERVPIAERPVHQR